MTPVITGICGWVYHLGSLNRVPGLTGWGTAYRRECHLCQVAGKLYDPIWHMSSRSGEACCEVLHLVVLLYFGLVLRCFQNEAMAVE